ncbi:nucleopolyhedrovirus P10 family protein [Streptomyces marokkonensis]|uniref:Nucleopolyhedrovirus P10 family protein n=1 Tax=Streptomyces marokkonensis TaxID=324855 RepID=A0ABW6QDD2_9ACTN
MTADRWTQAVRQQVGLGRIVPLGGPRDGAWIAERAAAVPLRRAAARAVPGVRLDGLRIGPAEGPREAVGEPVVPAPPSALPPGPLRLAAEFAATASRPLPVTASLLRTALAEAAERIGLAVTQVDLRVTELLDTEPPARPGAPAREPASGPPGPGGPEAGRIAAAALAVPGVTRLTGTPGRPVHLSEHPGGAALPHRHARVDLAVRSDHHPLEVARAVRTAVAASLPDRPTVTVLVTALD